MKQTFPVEELEFRNGFSHPEQVRTRKIFESLRKKALAKKILTEHEKNFLCLGLRLSNLDDGKIDDYDCCDNPKFKFIYLSNCHDLTGGSPVYKPSRNLTIDEISSAERTSDLNYLNEKSEEWEAIISITNHSTELLNQASKEVRTELQNLEDKPEIKNDPYYKGTFRYQHIKLEILLKSKYIYCSALVLLEKIKPQDLILNLNSIEIEINEYSIIHILNRHFAPITRHYDTQKDFFKSLDFEPNILNHTLKVIFDRIDKSGKFKGHSLDKIAFKYKGIDYQIWTAVKQKHIKGTRMLYRRLNSFYPISDPREIKNLKTNSSLVKIDAELFVYLYNSKGLMK